MRKTPLRPISKKPSRLAARFVPKAVLKEVKERSGGRCEVVFRIIHGTGGGSARTNPDMCTMSDDTKSILSLGYRCSRIAQSQPHHILKRSRGGKHTKENLLAVCFECHVWIENNDKEAVKYGLSLPYANYTP